MKFTAFILLLVIATVISATEKKNAPEKVGKVKRLTNFFTSMFKKDPNSYCNVKCKEKYSKGSKHALCLKPTLEHGREEDMKKDPKFQSNYVQMEENIKTSILNAFNKHRSEYPNTILADRAKMFEDNPLAKNGPINIPKVVWDNELELFATHHALIGGHMCFSSKRWPRIGSTGKDHCKLGSYPSIDESVENIVGAWYQGRDEERNPHHQVVYDKVYAVGCAMTQKVKQKNNEHCYFMTCKYNAVFEGKPSEKNVLFEDVPDELKSFMETKQNLRRE